MMIHPSGDDVIAGEDDATPRVFSDGRTVSNLHHGAGGRAQLGTSCLAGPERRASDVGGASRGRTRRRSVRNVDAAVTRDHKILRQIDAQKMSSIPRRLERRDVSESSDRRAVSCVASYVHDEPPPPPEYERFRLRRGGQVSQRSTKKDKSKEFFISSVKNRTVTVDRADVEPNLAVHYSDTTSPDITLLDDASMTSTIRTQLCEHLNVDSSTASCPDCFSSVISVNSCSTADVTYSRDDTDGTERSKRNQSCTFDGTDFHVFKWLFNTTAANEGWNETKRLQRLIGALRGKAKNVMLILEDRVLTSDLLMQSLEATFNAERTYSGVLDRLESMVRKPDQSLFDYAVEVKRMLSLVCVAVDVRKRLARHYFVKGLRGNKELQKYVDRKDTKRDNMSIALYAANEWERKHGSPRPVTPNASEGIPPTSDQRSQHKVENKLVINENSTSDEIRNLESEQQSLKSKLSDIRSKIDQLRADGNDADVTDVTSTLRLSTMDDQRSLATFVNSAAQHVQPVTIYHHVPVLLAPAPSARLQELTSTCEQSTRHQQEETEAEKAQLPPVTAPEKETVSADEKQHPATFKTFGTAQPRHVWVRFQETDVKALAVVDENTDNILISLQLFESLPEACREELEPDVDVVMRQDKSLRCYGKSKIAFELNDAKFMRDMYVVEGTDQLILGRALMADDTDAMINYRINRLEIDGQTVKLFDIDQRISHRATLDKTITLSAGREAIVWARVRGKYSINGRTALLEPARRLFVKTGALTCKCVVTPVADMIRVRIFNPSDVPISIFHGTTLGVLRDVDQTRAWTAPAEPVRDEVSADQPRDAATEIRHFSKLPTLENGDIDFDKVPDHLQDLYNKSVELLNAPQKKTLSKLFHDYEDVFAKDASDIGRAKDIKHHVDTGTEEPVHQRPRRQAKAHAEDLQRQVKKLADCGVIRPSESEWASNVVMARKKDGTWRMCVDYRELNMKTKNKGTYMLPRIDDTLDSLHRAKFFCTLDIIQGYHHVELTEDSKAKTAFHAPRCNPSHWEYNYMPFGLVGAPRTFQRMMDRIIRGLEYKIALAYLDDIIVYGATIEECLENLRIVFARIRTAGLKLKPSKCSLFQLETNYLGHIISADGVKTDPKKVEDVKNFAQPRNVKDVQVFMGMTQYYSKFIKDFMIIAVPLYKLMKKGVKFVWGPDQDAAFETLKHRFITAPVLAYPIDDARFILDTDASNDGMGAVLSQMQKDENGDLVERPIAYSSKKFSDTEKHYCARRRELLAIVYHVKHYDAYLRGQNFTIRTDHASLRYIKTIKELPSQFHRWVMTMEEYTYEIEVRKGTLHTNADAMSRLPCKGNVCICDGVYDLEETVGLEDSGEEQAVVNALVLQPRYTPAQMAEAQRQDPDTRLLYAAKINSQERPKWNDISGASPAAKAYFTDWKRIEVRDGMLYRRWENDDGSQTHLQLIVPFKFQRELMKKYHDKSSMSHLGKRRCYAAIQRRYFWYKMHDDIRWWIRTCEVCQRRKRPQPTPKAPMRIYVTGFPNERISMDVVGPMTTSADGNKYLLCITCHFSKFAKAYPIKDQSATTLMDVLMAKWCEEYGEPMQVHSDQGGAFEGNLTTALMKILDVEKTRTVAFKPSSDGLVERYNQTIVDMVAKLSQAKPKRWDKVVGQAVSAYNGSIHSRTGFTPNKLWFGREVYHNADLMMPTREHVEPATTDDYVKRLEEEMRLAYDVARETIGKNMKIQKKYYDRTSHLIKYKEGDVVWLKDHAKDTR